jgi:hypothetical protein
MTGVGTFSGPAFRPGDDGLAVAVLTTGHGPAVAADGQVLINTRRMSDVHVDAAARTAGVGGGVRWQQVLPRTGPHGLAPLNGSSPHVGVVGYTLGGGVGRSRGFAADRVRAVDIVTADGQFRHVTADSDAELFWAVRGGKGNFGVVVGLEFDLVPVSRLYGGGLFFPAEATADVLHTYSRWATATPEELSSSVLHINVPPDPRIPEPFRGKYIAHVRLAYTGTAEQGERLVQPLRDTGSQVLDTLGELAYTQVGAIYNDPADPVAAYDSNTCLRALDADAVDTILSVAGPDSYSPLIIELRQLGGAYARTPSIPSAVGLCGVGDADPERVKLAFTPADQARLAEAKTTYDPTNMFRINFNIPPASRAAGGGAVPSPDRDEPWELPT